MKLLLLTLLVLLSWTSSSLLADSYSEALTYLKTGELEQALQTIDKALDQESTAPAHELKGRILTGMQNYDLAFDEYEKVVKLDPKRASTHFYIGEAFFEQERWSEAFGAYRFAVKLDPKYTNPILKIIYSLIIMENYPQAHQWLTTLDPTNDLNPDYYFARAAMSYATGTPEEYVNALRQARTIYSTQVFNQYEPDLLRVVQQVKSRKTTPDN